MSEHKFPRHGSPYDRGSADKYYGRDENPHYYKGETYSSELVEQGDMTPEQVAEYNKGYEEEQEEKDWE